MEKREFSFELVDTHTPETVIKMALEQIEKATRGYVVGKIEEYGGPISSYTKQGGLASALIAVQSTSQTVDIQEKLGEQGEEDHKYEVYLSARELEHYKYRMMFVNYGTISYPAKIVMNEELAIEYSGKRNDTFYINSMKELSEMINTVFDSSKMIFILQSLINESLRQENKQVTDTENAGSN